MDEQETKQRQQEAIAEKLVEDKSKSQERKRDEPVKLQELFPERGRDADQANMRDRQQAADHQRLANVIEHDQKMGDDSRPTDNFQWEINEKEHTARPDRPTDGAKRMEHKDQAAELRARDENVLYDKELGSHARSRHGPQVTEDQLIDRLRTGIAPDNALGPTDASSKFFTEQALLNARTDVERKFLSETGRQELTEKPAAGEPQGHRYNIDYERDVGMGFQGVESSRHKAGLAFPENEQQKRSFSIYPEVSGPENASKCDGEVRWNEKRGTWYVHTVYPSLKNR